VRSEDGADPAGKSSAVAIKSLILRLGSEDERLRIDCPMGAAPMSVGREGKSPLLHKGKQRPIVKKHSPKFRNVLIWK
jgi:hypothetical protein